MKFIRYALALALLSSGGLFAENGKPAKDAKYRKIEAKKKQTHAYARKEAPKKGAADRYGKPKSNTTYKKMETSTKKTEKGLRKPTTKPAVAAASRDRAAVATPATAKTEPSMVQRAERWLGLGAAGAAATKAVGTTRTAGYHVGPRGWNHNFGPGWGNKGWVEGTNEHGHWVFAGYRPSWWETNYPTYYKDVVHPLYKKSAQYSKEETLRHKEQPVRLKK